ncbi:hypothetical protein WJ0W_005463 [Paenibacillus melissococcoides]|uniref:Uncharacterized protein n=1 Tax=Paenibacillus melissococcoides TaxID=2912268 RepID=A0ABM9G910_9BACL|nr:MULTISPECIES: hypothetical protein [Paenibacillus]MEB9897120.1 hypothetical protein [Bacillus cereus]CAH8248205.1 hypothetical protein WJ0W_005463 [Paenibacillus melissococcoides]CAH8718164.1 hypothetical protein HTL2_005183 [Paenibacillus melissococcoides]CAH8718958.1 hypothetical protein WDD9_005390 [Paenibacillus melissococcoides]GIO82347.1 hypothetical protein J6TS7_59570 [Paenibacillus dendritiformis]
MDKKEIQTVVLISEEDVRTIYRFRQLSTNGPGQFLLELWNGQVIRRFVIRQTDNGLTELVDEVGNVQRVVGVSYGIPNNDDQKVETRFAIADSFHSALNLWQFVL